MSVVQRLAILCISQKGTNSMSTTGSRPQLKLIDGGRSLPVSQMHRLFLDAYATNTRLMGVIAVIAHWSIISPGADRDDPENWEDLHQFFYIDCEEAGLETYQQVRGSEEADDLEAERIENALVCGLGGSMMELDERQLHLLLQHWSDFNEAHGLPLPAGLPQYKFLLRPRLESDAEEQQELMEMLCAPLWGDGQRINYFLMRCFGQDYEGARYLCGSDDVPLDLYSEYVCATFYRNEIELYSYANGAAVYRCESLIEMDAAYEIVVSLVSVQYNSIVGLEFCDRLRLTTTEAALILKRKEYFICFDLLLSEEDIEDNIDEFTLGFHTTMSEYNNGTLFMRYREDNSHVNRHIFLLNDDVAGMFFLTLGGQLVLCAYSLPDLVHLKDMLIHSPLKPYLANEKGVYCFAPDRSKLSGAPGTHKSTDTLLEAQSMMLQFMNSDYERFEDCFRPMS